MFHLLFLYREMMGQIRNIILFNGWHLGDALFSQMIVRNFVETNPHLNFTFLLHNGVFLYQDILRLNVAGFEYVLGGLQHSYQFHQLMNETTLALNLWVFGIASMDGPNWDLCHELEVRAFRVQTQLQKNLLRINEMFGTDLRLQDFSKTQLLPEIPATNVMDMFCQWNTRSRPWLFYYNYEPRSGQTLAVEDHDEVVMELAGSHPNLTIIVPEASTSLQERIEKTNRTNIMVLSTAGIGCERQASSAHLGRMAEIFLQCDYGIVFDVGASLFFMNKRLLGSRVKIIYAAVNDQLFNYLQENMEGEYLEFWKKHVQFCSSSNSTEFMSKISDMIQA